MTNKELAAFAKELGYEHIITIVKTHFNSKYWNINKTRFVLSSGKFDPAPAYNGYAHGTITSELPESCIERTTLRYMYQNKK